MAALSRVPITVTHRSLPGLPELDAQARAIEFATEDGMTVIGIYLPNGNSGGEAGYAYKLAWMDALCDRVEALLADDVPVVVLGDFNVCPEDRDFSPGALPPPTRWCAPKRARGSAGCCGPG